MKTVTDRIVALQRCDEFVGRTTNWLYDHLRFVPRYIPIILCDRLANREEFPALEAWGLNPESLGRRIWRRMGGQRPYPSIAWRLRRLTPRLLHSHFGYVAGQDDMLQQFLNVPWVVSFYGADVYQIGRLAEWQQTYTRVFERAARVLALGPMMAIHLEQLGCPREKIIIHPLGIDVESLRSMPRVLKQGEPLRLLFAGTFREKKGIQYVVEAAAQARSAGICLELHLVGDAGSKSGDQETKEAVFRQIRDLNLEDIVTHHSFLSFQELISLALRSHIFVAPSVTAADGDAEGTPFVLQQMMATGMPVIATLHSDIPYVFGEHRHLLVPERDSTAITERLLHYIKNPAALVSDGMKLRQQMRLAFDIHICATRLSAIYDAVQEPIAWASE